MSMQGGCLANVPANILPHPPLQLSHVDIYLLLEIQWKYKGLKGTECKTLNV